ncbi:fimbrial protein [Klebsiella aerogenes]|uniref:fimbrial protein n=1 Tax=Klebsiella aerogenes TaxID=548 RepID=UPI00063C626C|nr:fimbrial protein [Klebsiella aerogenes]KLF43442.1 fimbrial protein [Klebsiella aerogenes]
MINWSRLSGLVLLFFMPQVNAVDNWNVEGAHGVLNISGALVESPCRLEMDNYYQNIKISETSTAKLKRPGDQGAPTYFSLRLKDCLRTPTSVRDENSGALTWTYDQTAVSVTFIGEKDEDTPDLVKAKGVSGMGLRLIHRDGKAITLGQRNKPIILTHGKNVLNYIVTPERTKAPLAVGAYQALVGFRLSYD